MIKATMSAHLAQESDPGPCLPIERQVDEGRDAYKVESRWRHVTSGDSDRLDGLVDGGSPDRVNLDAALSPDDSRNGPGYQDRLGGGSNFEPAFGAPAPTPHTYETL